MDRRRKSDIAFGVTAAANVVLLLEMLLLHGWALGVACAAFCLAVTAVGWRVDRKTFPRLPPDHRWRLN
jgi:hypothetical protein